VTAIILLHAQSPAHWPGCFDFVNRPRCTVAAMLTIAAVIVSVFFAVWNPEKFTSASKSSARSAFPLAGLFLFDTVCSPTPA
jgi:hypothetical protein